MIACFYLACIIEFTQIELDRFVTLALVRTNIWAFDTTNSSSIVSKHKMFRRQEGLSYFDFSQFMKI